MPKQLFNRTKGNGIHHAMHSTGEVGVFMAGGIAEESPFAVLGWKPDKYTAYIEYRICQALPNVIGPELGGDYFGYHPAVLAAHYRKMNHKPVNLGHKMAAYGTADFDHMVGMNVAVWFPEEPEGGWSLDMETAPQVRVLAAVGKLANRMDRVMGGFQSGREPLSVSIESWADDANTGVWRGSTREIQPLTAVSGDMAAGVMKDEAGRYVLGQVEGEQLAFVLGGESGTVEFLGTGLVDYGAESVAGIEHFLAASGVKTPTEPVDAVQGGRLFAASVPPDQVCRYVADYKGRGCRWQKVYKADVGEGFIREVFFAGEHVVSGEWRKASLENPVVLVAVRGRDCTVKRMMATLRVDGTSP